MITKGQIGFASECITCFPELLGLTFNCLSETALGVMTGKRLTFLVLKLDTKHLIPQLNEEVELTEALLKDILLSYKDKFDTQR